ncbi:hypothetical protein JHK85_023484 [Glycine max]|nr:hypothetical protein JHK85_023484 [Glycine max]KAG5027101.1 hypothetical protein JHK86_023015 [Glycine max]
MNSGGYTIEVTCLSPKATEKHQYDFLLSVVQLSMLKLPGFCYCNGRLLNEARELASPIRYPWELKPLDTWIKSITSSASLTGRSVAAAANTMVNSSYFSKGAMWVSGALNQVAKVAADLGSGAKQ